MRIFTKSQGFRWAMSVALLAVASLIYVPGLTGPFVFDDHSNLTSNTYVKVTSLDRDSLSQAAYSLNAGPLQRPVAMLSFALNYYASGGFDSAFSYKLTNLVLHVINGILILILSRTIFARLTVVQTVNRVHQAAADSWLPLFVALIWLVHPIQLTSVLYVVQRMTELAALFSLLGLIAYLKAREKLVVGQTRAGALLLIVSLVICWPLALLSKETALLMPCFAVVLEWTLFSNAPPWSHWKKLHKTTRLWLTIFAVLIFAVGLAASFGYALPKYELRTFTLTERVMTEARVLMFYLSLILAPRLDDFGLHHDDIVLSTSLISPWTTLPAIAGIALLVATAWAARHRYAWLSLAIAWFFVGHLLESTIFPLEIAHEHRNYLPSVGIVSALVYAAHRTSFLKRDAIRVTVLGLTTLLLATITFVRSWQWSDEKIMNFYEAEHHPNSASALAAYSNTLLIQGQYEKSLQTIQRAAELSPREAGFLISAQVVKAVRGSQLDPSDHQEILERLRRWPPSATTGIALNSANDCIMDRCRLLQKQMEEWLTELVRKPKSKDASVYYFFLGRTLFAQGKINEAVEAYRRSYELDPNYFHPLFDLADLYLILKRPEYAQAILAEARRVNERTPHKRDAELSRLEKRIAEQLARKQNG